MKKLIIGIIVACIMIIGLGGNVLASATKYENYTGGANNDAFFGANWKSIGFKPQVTHKLSYIRVPLKKYDTGANYTITFELQLGASPSGSALDSATMTQSQLTTSMVWYTINFDDEVSLTADTNYVIVVKMPDDDGSHPSYLQKSVVNGYTRANPYISNNSGVSWTEQTGYDFNFEEYGYSSPACHTDEASNITSSAARLNGEIESLGYDDSVGYYFEYGLTTGDYDWNTPAGVSLTAKTVYADLTGLTANELYYYQLVIVDSDLVEYSGGEIDFQTLPGGTPTPTYPSFLDWNEDIQDRIENSLADIGFDNIFGKMLITLLGMIIVFLLTYKKNLILAISLVLLVFGLAIVAGWVELWVVILLGIVGGYIIYKLV